MAPAWLVLPKRPTWTPPAWTPPPMPLATAAEHGQLRYRSPWGVHWSAWEAYRAVQQAWADGALGSKVACVSDSKV